MHSTRFVAFSAVAALVVTAASCTSLLGDFNTPTGDDAGGAAASSSHHASSSSSTHTSSTSRTSTTHSSTRASSGAGGDAGGPANGGGGGSSSSGSGGNGGSGGCNTASDCAPPANSCEDSTCVGGVCGTTEIAPGLPARNQISGDCVTNFCDGLGNSTPTQDLMDTDDHNECTRDSCPGGTPHHSPNTGMRCNNGSEFCNDQGACVECLDSGDCPLNGACDMNFVCHQPNCSDSIKNQGETDKDCGGPCPAKCGDTLHCNDNSDCESNLCLASVCRAQTCIDTTLNGDESDTDCGGSCPDCADGKKCTSGSDCSSALCVGLVCRPATCKNQVKDAAETDVDCGGGACSACATGLKCLLNSDCTSGICIAASLTCM